MTPPPEEAPTHGTRAGFVALIGAPNAGKSTLLNIMVGTKVSIVSRKVQTTRTRVTGIALHDRTQIIFVDTPGIFRPRRRLDRAMVETAWAGARDADCIVFLVDSLKGLDDEAARILDTLKDLRSSGNGVILALNKIDLVKKDRLLSLVAAFNEVLAFEKIFMISAETGSGVADLKSYLAWVMPEGPWLYPPEQVSDISERLLASEITREKIYDRLHDELPYVTTVETEKWEDRPDGSVRIEQVIYVERKIHKPIVLGKGGHRIKAIGAAARQELEDLLGHRVHLFLFVKLKESWQDDPERYRLMNLPFNV